MTKTDDDLRLEILDHHFRTMHEAHERRLRRINREDAWMSFFTIVVFPLALFLAFAPLFYYAANPNPRASKTEAAAALQESACSNCGMQLLDETDHKAPDVETPTK